jgi:hypothetical protein
MTTGVTIRISSPDIGVRVMRGVTQAGRGCDFTLVVVLRDDEQFTTLVDQHTCLLLVRDDHTPRADDEPAPETPAVADEAVPAVIGAGDPAQPPPEAA